MFEREKHASRNVNGLEKKIIAAAPNRESEISAAQIKI